METNLPPGSHRLIFDKDGFEPSVVPITIAPKISQEAAASLQELPALLLIKSDPDGITVAVDGEGSCSYAIDFGDGNNDSRTATLPDKVQHNYPAAGEYVLTVTAIPPCSGSARRALRVRGR